MKKETKCVHSLRDDQGANTPIFPSTANKYIGYEENTYPRYFNTPNQDVIVEKLSSLEGAEDGLIFSSGMAAISTTIFSLLKSGDHAILSNEIYGGTYKLVIEEFTKFGIEFDFVTDNSISSYRSKIKNNTKVIYTETPSNPLLTVVNLNEIGELCKEHQLISIVDNTFATPINQNPIDYGIDVVIHSGTKYLGGHSDLCFGAVLTSKPLKERILKSSLNYGGSLNALDCYMIERSIKTLSLRVDKHNSNGLRIAEYLNDNKVVSKVYYPGLPDHHNYDIAKRQTKSGFGGMLSFELKNPDSTNSFLNSLSLIVPSLSLGGVETIICQPAKTSHVKMAESERLKLGITDQLLRLSVGIEDIDDIISDIDQALKKSA